MPDRLPEQERFIESQDSWYPSQTERGSEKLLTRVKETLKYGAVGFGLVFAAGFITVDIGLPLIASIAEPLVTSSPLEIPKIINTMLQVYSEAPVQLIGAGIVIGTGFGLNGALVMGGLRWQGSLSS